MIHLLSCGTVDHGRFVWSRQLDTAGRASAHFLVDGKDFTESGRNPEKGFDLRRRQEATAGKSGKHGASSAIPDPLQDPWICPFS
jgi:hypothetical protein